MSLDMGINVQVCPLLLMHLPNTLKITDYIYALLWYHILLLSYTLFHKKLLKKKTTFTGTAKQLRNFQYSITSYAGYETYNFFLHFLITILKIHN